MLNIRTYNESVFPQENISTWGVVMWLKARGPQEPINNFLQSLPPRLQGSRLNFPSSLQALEWGPRDWFGMKQKYD